MSWHHLFIDCLFIALAALTNLSYELSQSGVAEKQPASGSDAVGLVLKLLWFKIAEVTETVGEMVEMLKNIEIPK